MISQITTEKGLFKLDRRLFSLLNQIIHNQIIVTAVGKTRPNNPKTSQNYTSISKVFEQKREK